MRERDFTTDYLIIPMPCGCVVDVTDLNMHSADGMVIIECPWCYTSFERVELSHWHRGAGGDDFPVVQRSPRMMAEVDGKVIYAAGHCSCGCPLAIDSDSDDRKPFHLNVPLNEIKLLTN